VSSPRRSPLVPEPPTIAEAGLPGCKISFGMPCMRHLRGRPGAGAGRRAAGAQPDDL